MKKIILNKEQQKKINKANKNKFKKEIIVKKMWWEQNENLLCNKDFYINTYLTN